jgi:Na+/H+-translocating membrane pyrophosphatase
VLAVGGVTAAVTKNYWIGAALLLAAVVYAMDLRRQLDPESLQTPLTQVRLQTLSLSLIYAAMVVAQLW